MPPRYILAISTIFDPMKLCKTSLLISCLLLLLGAHSNVFAQAKDSSSRKNDSPRTSAPVKRNDSLKKARTADSQRARMVIVRDSISKKRAADSLAALSRVIKPAANNLVNVVQPDTLLLKPDTVVQRDSITDSAVWPVKGLLQNNDLIQTTQPVYHLEEPKSHRGKEFLFYALCVVVLFLGVFKTFYSGYFNNLFRVFFNTSLRQTQLTDQLLQARLPSLLLNIFFTITMGMYVWLLFSRYEQPRLVHGAWVLPVCVAAVAVVYLVKFVFLKFTGWVTNIRQATDHYIFVIFMVNKITGILLLPFVILLSFASVNWVGPLTTVSVLFLGLLFLSRYAKSYSLIENRMSVNPFHFVLYIIGAEIIPLVIVYKLVADYVV